MICAKAIIQRGETIMETAHNISRCVQDYYNKQLQEKSLEPTDIVELLKHWFSTLTEPKLLPRQKSEKVVRGQEDLQKYFSDLNQAVNEIGADPKKPYIEALSHVNNPFDFAKIFENIVEEILRREGKIDPNPRQAYYLYYFHQQQLVNAASAKWFSSIKQIGRVWA
jgi:hypothetical protein